MARLSFLGCGWLGLACVKKFSQDKSHSLFVSTKTDKNISILKQRSLDWISLNIYDSKSLNASHSFWKCDTLIITIPFERQLMDPFVYPKAFQNIQKLYQNNAVRHVLFTSSTSVYEDQPFLICKEDAKIASIPRSQALYETEKIFSQDPLIKATILRLGGLVGPKRHPGYFFRHKKIVPYPNKPVNLVHQDDVVCIIKKIIDDNVWGYTFNVVSDYHDSRKNFYRQATQNLKLPCPIFEEEKTSGKIVDNSLIKQKLSFQFSWNNNRFFSDI